MFCVVAMTGVCQTSINTSISLHKVQSERENVFISPQGREKMQMIIWAFVGVKRTIQNFSGNPSKHLVDFYFKSFIFYYFQFHSCSLPPRFSSPPHITSHLSAVPNTFFSVNPFLCTVNGKCSLFENSLFDDAPRKQGEERFAPSWGSKRTGDCFFFL